MGMGERKTKRYTIGLIIFLVPSFAQRTIILKEPGLDKSGFPLEKTSLWTQMIEYYVIFCMKRLWLK